MNFNDNGGSCVCTFIFTVVSIITGIGPPSN